MIFINKGFRIKKAGITRLLKHIYYFTSIIFFTSENLGVVIL